MKYWDSSAIFSLFVEEQAPVNRMSLFKEDFQAITWWGSKVECASAFSRLRREGALDEEGLSKALGNMDAFWETCMEILPSEEVRRRAIRLLRVHPLRAGDAFQLAAALLAAKEDPASLDIVTNDARLKSAAQREGFSVL